jgi:hypothetical protein
MFTILAAGPYFGGPMTRKNRLVVVKWERDGRPEFSVHTQFLDATDSLDSGSYCLNCIEALELWLKKVDHEVHDKTDCLLV